MSTLQRHRVDLSDVDCFRQNIRCQNACPAGTDACGCVRVIEHFSRKVACVAPLEGLNAGCIIEALEQALRKHGAPKHIISDQANAFIGDAFAELLRQWNIKPRFEAVGKHGLIVVTERIIKTLKYEWLGSLIVYCRV